MSTDVYDFFFPDPPPLREIASAAIAMNIYRQTIRISLGNKNHSLKKLFPDRYEIDDMITHVIKQKLKIETSVNSVFPAGAPSAVLQEVGKYMEILEISLTKWLQSHFQYIFIHHRSDYCDILNDFDDFAVDFNGDIHYVRTAERMIRSEKISQVEKFKIACMYCFERDVVRIWPSVSSDINSKEFESTRNMQYWLCHLRGKSTEYYNPQNDTVRADIFEYYCNSNWSSVEYFWKKMRTYFQQMDAVGYLSTQHTEVFVRYMLHKITDDDFLEEIEERWSVDTFISMLHNLARINKPCILAIWNWLHRIPYDDDDVYNYKNDLMCLFEDIFDEDNFYLMDDREYIVATICEIWTASSEEMKRPVVRAFLDNVHFVLTEAPKHVLDMGYEFNVSDSVVNAMDTLLKAEICISLFFTILSDASFEERRNFWDQNWLNLMKYTSSHEYSNFMDLCFRNNEEEIAEFKKQFLSKYENISERCCGWLELAEFEEVECFFKVCGLEKQTIRDFKEQLLLELLSRHPEYPFDTDIIIKAQSLKKFINDTFQNAELAADYTTRLISAPVVVLPLLKCSNNSLFSHIKRFIRTLASSEQHLVLLKQRVLNLLRHDFIERTEKFFKFRGKKFQIFLLWCMDNEKKVADFKRTIPIKKIIQKWGRFPGRKFSKSENEFLKWYFVTSDAAKKFVRTKMPKYVTYF